ncbi:hypothetical protein G9A89_017274 [Geosiphon pyriformis]|nr:hypothetical protein G9A89_017274 [Geosiphon pyriformis]
MEFSKSTSSKTTDQARREYFLSRATLQATSSYEKEKQTNSKRAKELVESTYNAASFGVAVARAVRSFKRSNNDEKEIEMLEVSRKDKKSEFRLGAPTPGEMSSSKWKPLNSKRIKIGKPEISQDELGNKNFDKKLKFLDLKINPAPNWKLYHVLEWVKAIRSVENFESKVTNDGECGWDELDDSEDETNELYILDEKQAAEKWHAIGDKIKYNEEW